MSKLNPQKASAYVGPGVLRKGGKITPVPNGPLIKKKGPYAGSTLRSGGKIKKAINGTTTTQTTNPPMTRRDSTVANIREQSKLRQNLVDFRKKVGNKSLTPELIREKDSLTGLVKNFGLNQRVKATGLTPEQLAKNDAKAKEEAAKKKDAVDESCQLRGIGKDNDGCAKSAGQRERRTKREARRKNGGPVKKAKAGAMIKRADGSMSKRGLWDNLRSKAAQNKKTGAKPKSPTKAMLVQEKKIKAKAKK